MRYTFFCLLRNFFLILGILGAPSVLIAEQGGALTKAAVAAQSSSSSRLLKWGAVLGLGACWWYTRKPARKKELAQKATNVAIPLRNMFWLLLKGGIIKAGCQWVVGNHKDSEALLRFVDLCIGAWFAEDLTFELKRLKTSSSESTDSRNSNSFLGKPLKELEGIYCSKNLADLLQLSLDLPYLSLTKKDRDAIERRQHELQRQLDPSARVIVSRIPDRSELPTHIIIGAPAGSGSTAVANAFAKSASDAQIPIVTAVSSELYGDGTHIALMVRLNKKFDEARKAAARSPHKLALLCIDNADSLFPGDKYHIRGQSKDVLYTSRDQAMSVFRDNFSQEASAQQDRVLVVMTSSHIERIPEELRRNAGKWNLTVDLANSGVFGKILQRYFDAKRDYIVLHADTKAWIVGRITHGGFKTLNNIIDAIGQKINTTAKLSDAQVRAIVDDVVRYKSQYLTPVDDAVPYIDDLVGIPSEVQEKLKQIVNTVRCSNVLSHLKIPKGLLLYGQPGTGKSYIMKSLARTLKQQVPDGGLDVISVSCSALQSVEAVEHVFQEAQRQAMSNRYKTVVMLLDEVEELFPHRTYRPGKADVVNVALGYLQGEKTKHGANIIVIGTTNFYHKVDEAIKRPGRFGDFLEIPLPSAVDLEAILNDVLRKLGPIYEYHDTFERVSSSVSLSSLSSSSITQSAHHQQHEKFVTEIAAQLAQASANPDWIVTIVADAQGRMLNKLMLQYRNELDKFVVGAQEGATEYVNKISQKALSVQIIREAVDARIKQDHAARNNAEQQTSAAMLSQLSQLILPATATR